jgi:hypothetical protein
MKKEFMVCARTPNASDNGLDTSKGKFSFHHKSAKMIEDPALAAELDAKYGIHGSGDIWVERDPRYEHAVNYHDGYDSAVVKGTHNFFFGPTKAYREGWERIWGKKDVT